MFMHGYSGLFKCLQKRLWWINAHADLNVCILWLSLCLGILCVCSHFIIVCSFWCSHVAYHCCHALLLLHLQAVKCVHSVCYFLHLLWSLNSSCYKPFACCLYFTTMQVLKRCCRCCFVLVFIDFFPFYFHG